MDARLNVLLSRGLHLGLEVLFSSAQGVRARPIRSVPRASPQRAWHGAWDGNGEEGTGCLYLNEKLLFFAFPDDDSATFLVRLHHHGSEGTFCFPVVGE